MRHWRLGLSCLFVATVHAAAAAQTTQSDRSAPRADHAVGYFDPQLRRVVLIGGPGDPTSGDRDAVWSWSGTRWDLVTSAGPTGRVNAAAAFEVGRGKAVVLGGSRKTSDGAKWEVTGDSWEGDARGWRHVGDLPPRDHLSLAEDGGGGVLMFGGIPAERSAPWPSETWRLRDGRWSRVATAGPDARGRTALAYDSRRKQVVLFGGVGAPPAPDQPQTFFGDTWVWNGEAWRKASDGGPPGRYAHGMVYDRARARTVLYGGIGSSGDTWEWDGQSWRQTAR